MLPAWSKHSLLVRFSDILSHCSNFYISTEAKSSSHNREIPQILLYPNAHHDVYKKSAPYPDSESD